MRHEDDLRSQQRGRVALVLLDNLKIHTPAGAKLVRTALEKLQLLDREGVVLIMPQGFLLN